MLGVPNDARLHAVAYRLLGSVSDAEDVVAEARYRLLKRDQAPENESAFLTRVVTNLALDRLRARKREREAYVGPWLPEAWPAESADSEAEGEALAALAEQLGIGFMLLLERLSPGERAVFVLREGFDYSYDEIAGLVGASAAACRQRHRRAKARLAGEAGHQTPLAEQRVLLDRLLLAVAARDTDALVSMFSEESVMLSDGGGVVSAAIRPITGRERIAQVIMHLTGKPDAEALQMRHIRANGGMALLLHDAGEVHSCIQVEGSAGVVQRLYVMRNPEKMRHLAPLVAASN